MRRTILAMTSVLALVLLDARVPATEWYETTSMRRDDPFMLNGFLHNSVFQSHDDLHDGVSLPNGNVYVQMRRADYAAVMDAVGHLRQRNVKLLTADQLARIRSEVQRRADSRIPFLLQLAMTTPAPEVGVVWTLFTGALDSDATTLPAQQLLALIADGGKAAEIVYAYKDRAEHPFFGIAGAYQVNVGTESRSYILGSATYPVKLAP